MDEALQLDLIQGLPDLISWMYSYDPTLYLDEPLQWLGQPFEWSEPEMNRTATVLSSRALIKALRLCHDCFSSSQAPIAERLNLESALTDFQILAFYIQVRFLYIRTSGITAHPSSDSVCWECRHRVSWMKGTHSRTIDNIQTNKTPTGALEHFRDNRHIWDIGDMLDDPRIMYLPPTHAKAYAS